MPSSRLVFLTGGTGYMGRRLIPELLSRGHRLRALVRPGSEGKLPTGCEPVAGNALDGTTFASRVAPADTFVQLIGVAHPSPAKSAEFRSVVQARDEGEAAIRATGLNATFLRPWYVLGPGHRWPYAILPFYWLLRLLPPSRDLARRLYPVTLRQMISALVTAVEEPASGIRIVEAPAIRSGGLAGR